jgi:hypothetical protein
MGTDLGTTWELIGNHMGTTWELIWEPRGNWLGTDLGTRCIWERDGNWKGMLRESIGDFLRRISSCNWNYVGQEFFNLFGHTLRIDSHQFWEWAFF